MKEHIMKVFRIIKLNNIVYSYRNVNKAGDLF
jgi:hypothetical protein